MRLASPAIEPPLRERLGLLSLSEVVEEVLSAGSEPTTATTCDDARASELSGRLRSWDFAAAASAVLGADAGRGDTALLAPPRHLRVEAIAAALRPYTVTLMRTLRTRLLHRQGGTDVTTPEAAAADAPWFIHRGTREVLLLAVPPLGLPLEHVLGQAVCELLGCRPPASLTPLLAVPPADAAAILPLLRVAPPLQWASASAVGASGTPCSAADEAMLQLRPLRTFFAGEVVAVDATQLGAPADGLVYAEVDVPHAPQPAATAGRRASGQIALRVGGSRAVMHVLPLKVHSFRSQRALSEQAAPAQQEVRAADGASPDAPAAQPAARSSAELVEAVSSVLRQAGVPVGLETEQLLEVNLRLQDELASARADLEERCIEGSKMREQIESSERITTCQICFQRRVNIALHGCGHLMCSTCAAHVERCPYCRGELTGSTQMRW